MAEAHNGDTMLYFETAGDPTHPTMLLVMGLGAQMTRWTEDFVGGLVERGFHVIRFDNRDVGLSSKTAGTPPALEQRLADPVGAAPYTLVDMADDAIAVLDAVDVEHAHICGASMGGMIVQTMAIHHPDRVASMCSIMSTTGDPSVGQAEPEILATLMAPVPDGRDEAIAFAVDRASVFAGPHFDRELAMQQAAHDYDRCWHPTGTEFQLTAIMAQPDRTSALADVQAPTLVVHGRVDPLVTLSGGEATAAAIPESRLVVYDDMAHDVPTPILDDMLDEITANTRRAG